MKIKVGLLVGLLVCSFVGEALAREIPLFYGKEVVVTALRVPRAPASVPWDTTVITRKDIENSTALRLGDIIRTVPGVSVKANGGLNSQISARLRGSNSQSVLVLLNGNRINSPSLGTFDLGDILLADVEKIEVVKAPLSALYGADAVGGVINVITKRTTDRPENMVSASYGEYATQNYSISGTGQNYCFSASSLYSKGPRANSDSQAQDFSIRVSGGMDPISFEVGVKKYESEKGSPGSLDFLTSQARQTDKNLFVDLSGSVREMGLKGAVSQSILDQKYENPAFALLSTHKSATTNFNLTQLFEWKNANSLLVGVDMKKDSSDSTNSGSHDLTNKALFVQGEYELSGAARMVVGGREDLNPAYGDHFNPRVGFVLKPWRDTFLKLSWGNSFRAPTFDDLYWSKTTEPGWPSGVITTEGNVNLKPETAQSYDITLERKLDPQTSARVSYYASRVNEMIRWANISTSTIDAYWMPSNVSNADIQGVEFEYKRSISREWQAFVNVSYEQAKDADSGKYLDYAPQNKYNAGLVYEDRSGAVTSTTVKYVGERYADLLNATKLPGYTVVDLSTARVFGRWGAKLDIENLFNESYAESYGFSDVYPMPGRRYNIKVSYKL